MKFANWPIAESREALQPPERFAARSGKSLQVKIADKITTRPARFASIFLPFVIIIGAVLLVIGQQYASAPPPVGVAVTRALGIAFGALSLISGIAAWFLVLEQESRRAAQEELNVQNKMLTQEIEAHEITGAQLQRAKERADSANVAKTRYVVGISHELRTPLNAIFGYAQLLERDPQLLKPQLESVRVMRRSAEHLANLVDGLLDISRMESGLFRLNPGPINLTEFLDQIVDMMRPQAANKGIEFHCNRSAHLPRNVTVDAKRLRQILLNLLSNAIKYTQSGSATLNVRYASEVATFEVIDTGIGIPNEDLDRIFEPFERGRMSATQSIPGTGLGLTIAHLLTSLMGGELTVESEVGKGSIFRVRLLLSRTAESSDPPLEGPRIRGYQGPRRKILIVDDDISHAQLLYDILAPLGFDLETAFDGASCLEKAAQFRPDLVLLDISMPGMSGWAVAQSLRQNFKDSLAIVMVSANVHEIRTTNRSETSHDAFLVKPLDIRRLLERLEDLLGLEWTYELPLPIRRAIDSSELAHIAHSVHIDSIIALCRIGHASGVAARLDELERNQPDAAGAIASLRELLREFRLREMVDYLETLRDDEW
ncbi:MAG TPA: ATP-binding protein [Micropepsaceae bacterium]|jgi:signal transduction histidine kinase/CheY-like chemotaxis protein|nr:ATP-binding protein [Micropepsaceae bacterium]